MLVMLSAFLLFSVAGRSAPILYGRISDAESHEGLLGVNVQLAEALRGTATDADGRYHLHLPDMGTWTVRVTHVGYRAIEQKVTAAADSVELNFALASDPLQAEEVVVTSEARESTARLSTTRVEVVDQNTVEQRSPGTLDRVLDAVPGVEAHRTGGSIVSNLSIRGSSDMLGGGVGNRTLLLVDGKPAIISDTEGASWWLYPDDVIERVEVVKGAYSALYGSNAMGGVVNLITRTPSHREYTRLHTTYGLYERPPAWMRYTERLNALSSLSFSHSNSIGRWGYFASATRRASDGFRESSAYENISAFSKIKYDYSPTRTFTFSTLYLTGENEYPHPWVNLLEPLRVRDIYTNDLQRKQSFSGDLLYSRFNSPSSSYFVRAFYNRDLTRSLLNPASDPREGDVPLDFQTRSISHKFGIQEQTTRVITKHNVLIFGAEAIWDEIDGQPETYLYGRQGAFSPGVYAQDDHTPFRNFHLTFGARHDYRHLRGGSDSRQFSPKMGVSYEALKDLVVRASIGHAFRNPSFAEMFLKKVGTQDYEFEPNPKLVPETVNFGSAGVNYRANDYAALDASAFLYKYENMIRWQTLAEGRYQTRNLSTATIQGFEIGVKTAWPKNLRQSAGVTYLDTDIDNKGPLTYVPKLRLFWTATYEFRRVMLGAELRHVSKTDTVVFYQNDAPKAYTLLDLRLAFHFRQNTSLALICENVTNQFYEEMERYRMPPRTYRVDLLYEFDVEKE
jgi:outer membrane receptor protein involved in Fe transport